MRIISAAEIERALDYPGLIDKLQSAFRVGCVLPTRHHHEVHVPGEPTATLLLMPAWTEGEHIGVKIATVFPGNADREIPAVMAQYLLMSARTGMPVALLDGASLTTRRTAAASALAARFLAREDAQCLVMIGTGALAPQLIAAHCSVRPVKEVLIWGRTPAKAAALADRLDKRGCHVRAITDLEAAVRQADIISSATLAADPLIHGSWLRNGVHLDLVGAFRPDMRETDDIALKRARIFVDTRAGALKEAGDLVDPIRRGVISASDVVGDLFELCRNAVSGRSHPEEITLFKSVGTALEDLAAAELAVARLA